jgi:tetratricopeptide (TPR) repeat protein
MIAPMARGCIGDAYMQLGNIDKAASYYMKAADYTDNDFTTPLHLKKAALAYEKLEKYDDALKNYERIKTDYFKSFEQRDIDKYIARAKKLAKK